MVYGTYITIVTGAFVNQLSYPTGASHCINRSTRASACLFPLHLETHLLNGHLKVSPLICQPRLPLSTWLERTLKKHFFKARYHFFVYLNVPPNIELLSSKLFLLKSAVAEKTNWGRSLKETDMSLHQMCWWNDTLTSGISKHISRW